MNLWRISNHKDLDGNGGLYAAARWHSQGQRIVYLAATAAGALVESLVHLELDAAHLPKNYQLIKVEVPKNVHAGTVEISSLPQNWRADSNITRTRGDEWLAADQTALLEVPSAILPETSNFLLNPGHHDGSSIRVVWHERFPFDQRLFKSGK